MRKMAEPSYTVKTTEKEMVEGVLKEVRQILEAERSYLASTGVPPEFFGNYSNKMEPGIIPESLINLRQYREKLADDILKYKKLQKYEDPDGKANIEQNIEILEDKIKRLSAVEKALLSKHGMFSKAIWVDQLKTYEPRDKFTELFQIPVAALPQQPIQVELKKPKRNPKKEETRREVIDVKRSPPDK
jgi:hypothetical protein